MMDGLTKFKRFGVSHYNYYQNQRQVHGALLIYSVFRFLYITAGSHMLFCRTCGVSCLDENALHEMGGGGPDNLLIAKVGLGVKKVENPCFKLFLP